MFDSADCAIHRRRRHRSRPIPKTSGWEPAKAGCATASRSATASTNRPTAARIGPTSGCKDSEHIAKILIDPSDSNTVYACATGHSWDDNEERGVYKTTDGGKTWRKVLAGANGSTGCAMLAMSAQDPKTLYASLWDFRRQAWTFRSGGPGSGLFKSTDGGEHWTELTPANAKGLPGEALRPHRAGRGAVQAAGGLRHDRIRKSSALFRSDDAGKNWTRLDASQYMVWRPFYFANLIVDPKDENKVFKVD